MPVYDPMNAIIVTCRHNGMEDATTVSWHTPVSRTPFCYAISIARQGRILALIEQSKSFCLNFLSNDMKRLIEYCGAHSGHSMDKIRDGKIAVQECEHIDCPRLAGSSSFLECSALTFLPVGDHTMIVGAVMRAH